MKNGGIDKRVIKTKNAIFEAFKQLVQEKDMADITISELTQKQTSLAVRFICTTTRWATFARTSKTA